MASNRLRRLAFQWGGLALVGQLWIALGFVHDAKLEWSVSRSRFLDFKTTVDRLSQLKAVAFKYPYVAMYGLIAAILLATVLGALWVVGICDAMQMSAELREGTTARPSSDESV